MCEVHNLGFNNEMKRLIRAIIEVTIEESYEISDVKDAISLAFKKVSVKKEEIAELKFEEKKILDIEKKLFEMFNGAWEKVTELNIKRMVILCSTYIYAKLQGIDMNMQELAFAVSKRINLKVSSIKNQISGFTFLIADKFIDVDKVFWPNHKISSKECLDELYKEYFQEEGANGYV